MIFNNKFLCKKFSNLEIFYIIVYKLYKNIKKKKCLQLINIVILLYSILIVLIFFFTFCIKEDIKLFEYYKIYYKESEKTLKIFI